MRKPWTGWGGASKVSVLGKEEMLLVFSLLAGGPQHGSLIDPFPILKLSFQWTNWAEIKGHRMRNSRK